MVDKNDLVLGVLAGKTVSHRFVRRHGEEVVHLQAGLREDHQTWVTRKDWTGEFYTYTVCGLYVCPKKPNLYDGYHRHCCNPAWRVHSTVAAKDPKDLNKDAVCAKCIRELNGGSRGLGVFGEDAVL